MSTDKHVLYVIEIYTNNVVTTNENAISVQLQFLHLKFYF